MPVGIGAVFEFMGYKITDVGITLHFVSLNPGAGNPNDYFIDIVDADLAGILTQSQFSSFLQVKLNRKYRATGIANTLDPYLGTKVTV